MSRSLHYAPVQPPPPSTSLGGHPVKGLLMDALGIIDGDEFILERSGGNDLLLAALSRIEEARLARIFRQPGNSATLTPSERSQVDSAQEIVGALAELRKALAESTCGLRLFLDE